MKFLAMILVAGLLGGCGRSVAERSAADELPKMVGKSAEQLAKDHSAMLKSLTANDGHFGPFPGPVPWHVWKFNTPEARYVVFSGQHIFMIPGGSSASILLLSAGGAEISSWNFSTGWRIDIQSASMSFDDKLQARVITIYTAPVSNGGDVAKQYFALVDDKLYFIRMEDSKGTLIRNDYLRPFGGELPAKDLAGWTALLESPKLPLRLAALTYLSGKYIAHMKDPELARAFRSADLTKKLIADYRKSNNTWLKEAADLAAIPADEYF